MVLDLATLAIVIAAALYLGWRWQRARHRRAVCAGCESAAPKPATQAVSLAQLRATLRR
jgi:hypothetical protein